MKLSDIKDKLGKAYERIDVDKLRPAQEKSVKAGLFEGNNLLVCTPTASGKTLVAEFAFIDVILKKRKNVFILFR